MNLSSSAVTHAADDPLKTPLEAQLDATDPAQWRQSLESRLEAIDARLKACVQKGVPRGWLDAVQALQQGTKAAREVVTLVERAKRENLAGTSTTGLKK